MGHDGGVPAGAATFVREPLGLEPEPWQAPLLVRDDPRPFALLGSWAGASRALAGSCPVRIGGDGEDPFALLDELPEVAGGAPPAGAVGGGWAGMLAFGLARGLEEAGGPPPRPSPLPLAALAYYDHVVRCDEQGAWWLEALVAPGREAAVAARFAALRRRAREPGSVRPRAVATDPWRWEPSPDGHARAVAACVERIAAGDLFQANLCLRLSSSLRAGEAVDLFATAWRDLEPVQAAWLAGPWGAVASLSPESFLRREGRRVASAPIKGTRPRVGPAPADAEARAELLASAKDGAEHVMIVDLVRNDLGRVCVPGSVRVEQLAAARRAPGVWHLVSTVAGELRPGVGDAELVRAAFPPGSVTGAPKVAALQAIGELESTGREAYTGALGLASPLAGLDLSVAIRTFEVRGSDVWLGVGGGIVADSDGAGEAREAAAKAAPLLAAIGGRIAREPPSAAPADAPRPPRLGPVPLPRPHPGAGVFETLLVRGGRAQHLPAHLERLASSARALYGLAVPAGLAAEVRRAARHAPDPGRLRVDVRPEGPGLRTRVEVSAVPPAPPPRLRAVCVPGGLGAHKLADRRLWDGLAAAHPGELVLAVDLDGHVLETARAAVLADLGGVLVAPPLDGRILPGTARARLLAAARAAGRPVAERPMELAELRAAGAVLLAGALRGVERAEALDGRALAGAGSPGPAPAPGRRIFTG